MHRIDCIYCNKRLKYGEKILCLECMADGRNLLKKLETIDIDYTESGEWKSNIDKEVENMRRRLKSALEKIEELKGE